MIQPGVASRCFRTSLRPTGLVRFAATCTFSTSASVRSSPPSKRRTSSSDSSSSTRSPRVPRSPAQVSTTTPHLPTDIAPESPRFVHVPQAPQQDGPKKTVVKGILPVPRPLFQGAREGWAIDPEVLASRTLEPDPAKVAAKLESGPAHAWKVRMAERRRENLRDGVLELYTRHKLDQQKQALREVRYEKVLAAAKDAPEREDERLTRPTVRAEILQLLEKNPTVPRHLRPEKIELRKRNYAVREAKLTNRRREALRKLLIDARKFIVTPAQLDDAIEVAFGTNEAPIRWGETEDMSVWGLGTQDPITQLARRSLRSSIRAPGRHLDDVSMTSGGRLTELADSLVPAVQTARLRELRPVPTVEKKEG